MRPSGKRRGSMGRGVASPRQRVVRTFLRNRTAVIGAAIAVCVVVVAALAPLISLSLIHI